MRLIITFLFLYGVAAVASNESIPPKGMSLKEWNSHIEITEKMKQSRKELFEKELKYSPPEPPWVKFPEQPQESIFWRMGAGETYLMEYVWPYFQYASEQELNKYIEKYPEPKEWKGWYKKQVN